jgi:hypothetical protein
MELLIPVYSNNGIEDEYALSISTPYSRKNLYLDGTEYILFNDNIICNYFISSSGIKRKISYLVGCQEWESFRLIAGGMYRKSLQSGWIDCTVEDFSDSLKRHIVLMQNDLIMIEPDSEL